MLPAAVRYPNSESPRANEEGWALLGLLLALGVLSIFLTSAIVPNVQMQVQRDKEAEMLYRGEQMAKAIARYYASKPKLFPPAPMLQRLAIQTRPLTDLAILRDGVTLPNSTREVKFVRPSAMIDPMTSSEWEPVRLRDPRIMKFLQAWLAFTQTVEIAQYHDYFLIAGPPQSVVFDNPTAPPTANQPTGPGATSGQRPPPDPNDPDPPDQSDNPSDPFEAGTGPIVGVVSKKKGKAMNAYFGLENYEEWIFMYIPLPTPQGQPLR